LIEIRLGVSRHALQTYGGLLHYSGGQEAAIRNGPIIAHFILVLCPLVMPGRAYGTELGLEAVQGFNRHVQLCEQRMHTELRPGGAFLRIDGLPEGRRRDANEKLQHGEVVPERLEIPDSSGQTRLPGAMIHHWVGTVFIPGVSMQQVLRLLQDYDHHAEYYSPDVVKSKLVEHTGGDFKVYLRLKKKKIVTVVLDSDYDVHYEQLDAARAQSQSYSTRIVEVEHPGEASERQLPPGNDNGYMWRLNSYWRFLEKDNGVYVQCEAISLTRDIPTGLNWLIGPFIESIPKESLEFTLQSTRNAVLRRSGHFSQ
jgi:hypothetical protein